MQPIEFTVDAALLRELGERLVGRPHIALAELVKNSYDADASKVLISFDSDRILVADDGHGMTPNEFREFWMRIGSPHKQAQRKSKRKDRFLTGSKGIGRLSAQFLAKELELRTISDDGPSRELVAHVDWTKAVKAGDLTRATALFDETSAATEFPNSSRKGTQLLLTRLNHKWTEEEFEDLAREIWTLQPPFEAAEDERAFEVELRSPKADLVQRFQNQMRAILDIWSARLVGRLKSDETRGPRARKVTLTLEFQGLPAKTISYDMDDCHLHELDFEIRVFSLQHKQPKGIKVREAREYLNRHGGVHVYDAGFHLPYYGVDEDWLGIEMDHSHRLSRSRLLPEDLQIPEGMTYLPTNSRLFGVVNVNTSLEARFSEGSSKDILMIQVSRDRLVDNRALKDLQSAVRWALDYYATEEAKRAFEKSQVAESEPIDKTAERLRSVLEKARSDIPQPVYSALRKEVQRVEQSAEVAVERLSAHVGLLGALATAGIGALSYEHEVAKQLHGLSRVSRTLQKGELSADEAGRLSIELKDWVTRARQTRGLFSHLLDEENRARVERFRARQLVDEVVKQARPFLDGTTVRSSRIPDTFKLPEGSFVEWTAILQNVLLNASNAMLHSSRKEILFAASSGTNSRTLLVMDTGSGVDLAAQQQLFEPFVRRLKLPREREEAGLGGSGLGLTIVRMIAEKMDCKVRFVPPESGYSTAFQVEWHEQDGIRG